MKKVISIFLILCIVFALISCSKNDKNEEKTVAHSTSDKSETTPKEGKTSKDETTTEEKTTKNLPLASNWNYGYAIETPKVTDTSGEWNLLLVNRDYILPEGYINSIELVNVCSSSEKLDKRAAQHYEDMFNAAAADGLYLTPCSGYRSYELQERNFRSRIDMYMGQGMSKEEATVEASKVILPPGTSEHNAGLAMDIICVQDSFEDTAHFKWLCENAQDYGFILRYPEDKQDITKIVYEPWHWRYVGVEAAKEMKKTGECLEEYLGRN